MPPFGQTIPVVPLRYKHTVSSKLNFTSNKTKTFFHYWWRTQFHTVGYPSFLPWQKKSTFEHLWWRSVI